MASWANVDGDMVTSGRLTVPYSGLWVADLALSDETAISGAVTLYVGDLALKGYVFRGGPFTGSFSARLFGGFGGWRKKVTPRAYYSPVGLALSTILGDVAIEVGEQVQIDADVTIGNRFVRELGPAARVLRQIAGPTWWCDPASGKTVVGKRPATVIKSDFTVEHYHRSEGRLSIASEVLKDWMPGRSFTAPTISTPKIISSASFTFSTEGRARIEVLTT